MELRSHNITLKQEPFVLRPLTEADWDILFQWNNDPEVLYYAEGDDVTSRSLDEIQAIYRFVSQSAFCFIIEYEHQPIGECWLQALNLDRLLREYPNADCRRIDLSIGQKTFWGRGIGTKTIRLLTDFAFTHEHADFVFACDVADYNLASQTAFQKAGYRLCQTTPQMPGAKARFCLDFVLSHAEFDSLYA